MTGYAARIDGLSLARGAASRALVRVLAGRDGLSEARAHRLWQAQLAREVAVEASGWFAPPPDGMSVLAGEAPAFDRVSFGSLRDPAKWVRPDLPLRPDSLVFVYCSPVHRSTGMAAEFAATLYAGPDPAVRAHLAAALDLTLRVAAHAAVGMEFRELYAYAASALTGPKPPDIGHTIPYFDGEVPPEVTLALARRDHRRVAEGLSAARSFVTADQNRTIRPDEAFTVSPRVTSAAGVQASFSCTVAFEAGVKTVMAGFTPLLDLFGMTADLSPEAREELARHDAAHATVSP